MLRIERFIPAGEAGAISEKTLATVLNVTRRDVRMLVENARREGVPICSTCNPMHGGYYLPLTKREARVYIRMQEHRIASAKACLKAVSDVIDNLPE